ncbi:hypothetical protein BH09PSE5_BH09PSE5_40650 [soil metagenome]
MSEPIDPRRVDWSGDNPGIYLKTSPDGDAFSSLCVWFRIAVSPFGPGHVLVLFEDPTRAAGWPDVANVCLADNEPLARWLIDGYCKKFGVFRGAAAFEKLDVLPLDTVDTAGTDLSASRVAVAGNGIEIELIWKQLGAPFAADVPPEQSATGAHRMLSVFVESTDASITVNGRRLPGVPVPRPFLGRTASSAFLAFSETWIAA